MRVLITGGAGFIGSHLAEKLLARGDRVLVIDNFSTGRRDNLPAKHPNLEVVEASIVEREAVDKAFAAFEPEKVVHAAASYRNPDAWADDAMNNVVGTTRVVQAAAKARVGRLIYFQTSLCYGLHPVEQPITLNHPLLPDSSYAISKTAAEQYIFMSGVPYQSFRLANMYGPRNLSGPVPTFYQRLSTGKPLFVADSRRDFMFIHDMLQVVIKGLDGVGKTGVYHIASGSDHSIKELYDAVVMAMGLKPETDAEVRPRSPDDAPTLLIDPSKTVLDFGWRASTSLVEGVKQAVAWYGEHVIAETYTHLKIPDTGNAPTARR